MGYKIHVLHADDKHDHRTQRCINASIGLHIPHKIKQKKYSEYMRCGKPIYLPQRTIDTAYSIVAQYQSEFRGIVQYYKMAYNLHTLSYLKFVMELSLVRTLASKHKITCRKIYKKFGAIVENDEGEKRKVIQVKVNSLSSKTPLITHFGAILLKWNKWVSINDNLIPIWSKRSEIVQILLAQTCELCKSQEQIEVHHVHKLADLRSKSNTKLPEWKKRMIERERKALVVCHECHKKILYGKYDGNSLKRKDYRRAT